MIGAILAWGSWMPWTRRLTRWGAVALAVLLFLLSRRAAGELTGRAAERLRILEVNHEILRRMLEAAARRSRSRDELSERLRRGRFCGRRRRDSSARSRQRSRRSARPSPPLPAATPIRSCSGPPQDRHAPSDRQTPTGGGRALLAVFRPLRTAASRRACRAAARPAPQTGFGLRSPRRASAPMHAANDRFAYRILRSRGGLRRRTAGSSCSRDRAFRKGPAGKCTSSFTAANKSIRPAQPRRRASFGLPAISTFGAFRPVAAWRSGEPSSARTTMSRSMTRNPPRSA